MGTLRENYQLGIRKIRASSVVFPFGVGAMIDMPEGVYMTASCDYWNKNSLNIIHDERLEKVLKVKSFKSPIIRDDDKNTNIYIPFVQFPQWMFCPKCRKFQSLQEWEKQYKILSGKDKVMDKNRCPKCRVKLSPARIVTVCEDGHIDDFPWIQWVHYKNNKSICSNPDIYIKTNGVSSGLEGIVIECRTCNIRTNLTSVFNKDKNVFKELEDKVIKNGCFNEKYSLACKGNEPWKGTNTKCTMYPTALQRGATNIYFPKVESSILIPPYSEKINNLIENSESYKNMISSIETMEEIGGSEDLIKQAIEVFYRKIGNEIGKSVDIVKVVIDRKLNSNNEKNDELESINKYKEEEYKAIIGEVGYDILDQVDFKVEEINGDKYSESYIDKVVLIHKMKEVRALVGFSRINAPDSNIMEVDEEGEQSALVRPLDDTTWYPAVEVRGEGIFIKFNDKEIIEWIKACDEIEKRANYINKKYNNILKKRGHHGRKITSKFLLLHTLAHLIIKEVSFKCGYSTTALRERIYCNTCDQDYNMSGILIYTANGDSEGTMGGLVRQGREDKLPLIINSAIEKARFCSSDPVCIESRGQGRDALNLSACYSCTLISETSCEEFNTLLDRAMIVGTLDEPKIGFFNFVGAD